MLHFMKFLAFIAILPASAALYASDVGNPLERANQALASEDSDAKKVALRSLADRRVGDDDQVLPILVHAVGDRQAHDVAVAVLRQRTGLEPSPGLGVGGYPGYPESDTPEQWLAWLAARASERQTSFKLDALSHQIDQINARLAEPPPEVSEPPEERPESTSLLPAPDEGIPSVVELREGRRIVGNIVDRRVDDEGYLLSIDISHHNAGGLETITADRIFDLETVEQ
jgi:hypothetical protein